MRTTRAVADVRSLPRTVFGHRALMWWGTLGFIVIEGTTLFICAVTYFYLRRNFSTWPPEHLYRPALLVLEMAETLAITGMMFGRQVEERDLSGVSDNAVYWYFLSGAWIPLYV